jgi:Zn-dependent M16 (insulinase) family peptidase
MKWFHIHFKEAELSSSSDERLIKDFITLLHKLQQPNDLGLYQLKFRVEDGQVIYISTPDEYTYKLKSILAHYPVQKVSRPNLKVLKLVLGKGIQLE